MWFEFDRPACADARTVTFRATALVNAVLAAIGRACYADTQSAACAQAAYDAVPPRARERGSKSTPIAGVASLAAPR